MKNKPIKAIFILITILILCIFFFFGNRKKNNIFQDDILFFKWFNLGENREEKAENFNSKPKITFQVSNKNIDSKEINLETTIDKNTLIYKKIAPGTSGAFEIILETNEKVNYQIKFKSKNEKPKNLNFQLDGKDRKYQTLEEMEKELKGELKESKTINISWKWEYEISQNQDIQDTRDGEKLKQYQFEIYVIGDK